MKKTIHNGVVFSESKSHGYMVGRYGGKQRLLHRIVYMESHGIKKLPKGFNVHHINGDKTDNRVENLALISDVEHGKITYGQMTELWQEKRRRYFAKGIDAAKAWHKSKDGIAWHKRHYHESIAKSHEKVEKICEYCGKKFIGERKSRFCSKVCTRRNYVNQPQNFIEIKCSVCGKIFSWNKLNGKRPITCSRKCSSKLRLATLKKSETERVCIECGKKFTATSLRKHDFCCKGCYTRNFCRNLNRNA